MFRVVSFSSLKFKVNSFQLKDYRNVDVIHLNCVEWHWQHVIAFTILIALLIYHIIYSEGSFH